MNKLNRNDCNKIQTNWVGKVFKSLTKLYTFRKIHLNIYFICISLGTQIVVRQSPAPRRDCRMVAVLLYQQQDIEYYVQWCILNIGVYVHSLY